MLALARQIVASPLHQRVDVSHPSVVDLITTSAVRVGRVDSNVGIGCNVLLGAQDLLDGAVDASHIGQLFVDLLCQLAPFRCELLTRSTPTGAERNEPDLSDRLSRH